MVKELVASGFKGRALLDEVMRLTGLPAPHAQLLIDVELKGQGDTDPPLGPTPDLSHILSARRPRPDLSPRSPLQRPGTGVEECDTSEQPEPEG